MLIILVMIILVFLVLKCLHAARSCALKILEAFGLALKASDSPKNELKSKIRFFIIAYFIEFAKP